MSKVVGIFLLNQPFLYNFMNYKTITITKINQQNSYYTNSYKTYL
ncbi:hypothetical protein SAMN05444682_110240 [Parapedobacter indicus]|uniref:Uncharacterized protein n=1 Tax=Parapedobacter indicus TaxID=1477437 RepID=A0A1I3S6D4_9SPHI|nr:hypothetical protein CLV26_1105 [Parapedobacter indicus]SFJ53127.1 hypothetical protein SAMN05444682_110240 [Parapedobacter indicus]